MKTIKQIKTRFAPSPTGDLHIGGLRTALYNYLFAKKNSGEFFLRIEDTDQARYKEGSVEKILESLEWAGLKWDSYKSQITNHKSQTNSKSQILNSKNFEEIVFQSQRIEIYKKYAQKLINKGKAYYCFCSEQTLAKMRQEQINRGGAAKYDRQCLKLTQKEVEGKLKKGTPHVVRLKIPAGQTKFKDLIRGELNFDNTTLDDQVLLKSDGYPTYHLACVVDDHEMGITHVIRAEEWLPSTPKHIILYNYFNWDLPEFTHLPMVLAPDKSKLSKRHGATSVLEFKKLGYLPQALINYLALLGWNPDNNRELFTLEELKKEFSLEKIQKAGAIFDINKLDWMNGYYIRQMSLDKLTGLCLPYIKLARLRSAELRGYGRQALNVNYAKKVVSLEQERMKKLSEIVELTEYFFKEIDYPAELLKWRKSDLVTAKRRLEFLKEELPKVPKKNWTQGALEEFIKELIEAHHLGAGETLWPMRVALSGRENSPGPFEIAEILGKEESLKRIEKGIEKI